MVRTICFAVVASTYAMITVASGQTSNSTLTVSHPSGAGISPALSDLSDSYRSQAPQQPKVQPRPKPLPQRAKGPGRSDSAAPQTEAGAPLSPDVQASFAGIGGNGYIPSDANIAVGPAYIVQVVNSEIAIFDKSGTLLSGPKALGSIWSSLGGACANNNAGDPVVQYDKLADRWLITQLGSINAPYSECIAVSTGNDPRGSYYLYSYNFGNDLNDYPKFAVWPPATDSAYLASYNIFALGQFFTGGELCAYDRAAMLSGSSNPTAICYLISNDGGFLPADLDGSTPPGSGSPGYFLNFETLSSLRLYKLAPDFSVPNNSTLTLAGDLAVTSFNEACGGGACIPEKSTVQVLDSVGDRLMYRLAYRNFGDHESLVVNHSVATGNTVGVRWYELTAPGSHPGQFSVYQQATYSPDSTYRWMGSMAMDKLGDMALGYSASGSSLFPEIVATGRTPADTLNTMRTEFVLQSGGGAQVGQSRWGDYTAMRIDPADDCTFWYTNQYYQQNSSSGAWSTSINSFKINSNCTGSTSYNLSLSVFGSRGGTITGSPSGISCPTTCSASYASGTQVTLTATAADGNWHFAGWGGACSGTGTCTVTMNANQSVTAAFLIADQFLVFPGIPDAGSAPQPPLPSLPPPPQ